MRTRTTLRLLAPVLALSLVSVACGEEVPVDEESADPIVGLMELPISLRYTSSAPSNALRIEVSPDRLRLDAHTVVELSGGSLPEGAVGANRQITALKQAIDGGAARRVAELTFYGSTPWDTSLAVFETLQAANIGQLAFVVRAGATTDKGYLMVDDYAMVDPSQELAAFEGPGQRSWDDFRGKWQEIYQACRADHYVDCAYVPGTIAEGGQLHMTLFARGSALKIELHRFGIEDPPPSTGPALIDGVGLPTAEGLEVPEPPATEAAFTWRARAATDPESPIIAAMRPLCGTQACGALVQAEGQTMTMRIVSFLGSAYPTGSPNPVLRFQRNP